MSIKENIEVIKDKISQAEKKAGRKPGSVKLMAVSKFHTLEEVQEAVNCGQLLFGENRVQEAEKKFSALYEQNPDKNIELHIIGQLQTNKVKSAVCFILLVLDILYPLIILIIISDNIWTI